MLEIGTILQDRFLIEERIGTGGMGAVYLATDQKFGSRVAIKQTIHNKPELAQAFEREARILNSLHHPVLPHVSDFFSENEATMLVMEYIEGEDLSELLKRGERLSSDDIVRWTFELLDALDYLHSQDPPIIHRDIKPNNLKVTPRGNIVLLDFGLAKETSGNTLGVQSVFGYSRRYSPLEQIEGTGTDSRSDIFALGATIFHLLTGKPPIDVLARASAIAAGRPDPLKLASELNPDVPIEFAALVRSALAINAKDRFETAAAMRNALEHTVGNNVAAASASGEETVITAPAVAAPSEGVYPEPQPAPDAGRSPNAVTVGWPADLPWRTPALGAALILIAVGLVFGLFKSFSPRSASPERVAEAAPVRNAENVEQLPANVTEADAAEPEPEPVRTSRRATESTPKNESRTEAKRTEPVVDAEPATAAEEPPRPRVVKAPAKRNRQPAYDDEPPVESIERIFTGAPARGADPGDQEITKEEYDRIRRDSKRKAGKRKIKP
jgi:predicted Ser/Thr protein kinase